MRKLIKYKQWDCYIEQQEYMNGRIALQLLDIVDHQRVMVATINVPEINIEDNQVIIKNYSENNGMIDLLLTNNIVTNPKRITLPPYNAECFVCDLV